MDGTSRHVSDPGAGCCVTQLSKHGRCLYAGCSPHLQGLLAAVAAADTTSVEASTSGSKKDLPLDKLCEVCLSFAHLSSAAPQSMPTLPLLRFEHVRAPADAVHAIAADAPALRSRGPPIHL